MTKAIGFFSVLFLSHLASAQWKEIGNFGLQDEYITRVYFLDLPGPPRIGFVGTGTNLYKTSDGGSSWRAVWGKGIHSLYYVTDIFFKDSLTGWITVFGDTDACYRTLDGGNSWKEIYSANDGGFAVYYSPSSNRLFLSLEIGGMVASNDLGDTWEPVTDTATTSAFTFWNDSDGIVLAIPNADSTGNPVSNAGFLRTTNGGRNWEFNRVAFHGPSLPGEPIAIPGTHTCFAVTQGRITVWRSDDFGATWSMITDFGPLLDSNNNQRTPYCTGYIKGELRRLSIQTDSGMLVSTDSGFTWRNDRGPTYLTNFSNDNFYSRNGITVAGMTYGAFGGAVDAGGGLWEEQWDPAAVQGEDTAARLPSAFPNPASDVITISGLPESGWLEIRNIVGERVFREPLNPYRQRAGSLAIDVSGYAPGIYFIEVSGHRVGKFLKQ